MIAKFRWLIGIAALTLSLAACKTTLDAATPTGEPIFNGTPMSQVTLPPPSQSTPGVVVRDQTIVDQRIAQISAGSTEPTAEPTDAPTSEPTPDPTLVPEPITVSALPPSPADFTLPEGAVGRLGIGGVNVISLSPSREFLVASLNGRTYMLQAGTLTRMWRARHGGRVTWLADGQRVGIGSVIYDAITGTEVAALPLDASAVAYSPDGALASTHDIYGTVVVWDVLTGARLWNMPAPEDIARHPGVEDGWTVNMTFSPDNQYLAISSSWQAGCVGSSDDQVHVFYARGGGLVGEFTATGRYYWTLEGAWSPTGRYLVVKPAGIDSSGAGIYDMQTSTLLLELPEAGGLAWSPDGTQFAVIQGEDTEIWDAASAARVAIYKLPEANASTLSWSRDGSHLAVGSYRNPAVTVINVSTGEHIAEFAQAGPLVGFGTDNTTVIAGLGMQNSLAVWHPADLTQPAAYLQGMTGVNSLAWSPDGSQILSTVGAHYGHRDGYVNWDVPTLTANFAVSGTSYMDWMSGDAENLHVDWSADGRLAAISTLPEYSDGEPHVTVIDVVDHTVLYHIKHITPLQAEFSPDGSRLAVRDTQKRILIYNAADGKKIASLKGDEMLMMDIAWSPNGTQIAAASVEIDDVWVTDQNNAKVSVIDVATGEIVYDLSGLQGPALSVAWSPDGTRIAASTNIDVAIWNAGAANTEPNLWLYSLLELDEFSRLGFTDIAFSPDGTMIAGALGMPTTRWYCNGCGYGDRGMVMVWDAYTAERLHRFEDHTAEVQTVAFSPDGRLLASGSLDGTILLWDMSR